MQLVLNLFLTLDGVTQAPGAPDEDRSGGFDRGGWLAPYADQELEQLVAGYIDRADAFLLGRRTYEIFAAYWPHVADPASDVAAALNQRPKYVASTTLRRLDWAGSTLLPDDVPEAVARLRREPGQELQIHGSTALARTLLSHDLVDECRLWFAPVVLGDGGRLFPPGSPATRFTLAGTERTGTGVVIHTYRPAGRPEYGEVTEPE